MTTKRRRDPYSLLDVGRDADANEVNRAFRGKAKKAHPDAGGRAEDFADIKWAQLVLCDPAARSRYDATGEADETGPNNEHAIALQHIARLVDQIIVEDGNVLETDLIAAMTEHLRKEMEPIQAQMMKMRAAKARALKLVSRFKRRRAGPNFIARMFEQRVRDITEEHARAEKAVAERAAAIALLEDFTFECDQPAAFTQFMTAAAFSSSFIRVSAA